MYALYTLPVSQFTDTSSCDVGSNEGIDEVGGVLIRVGEQRGG